VGTGLLKTLAKGLLIRIMFHVIFGLGFLLLFQGFLRPSVYLGFLGGCMILGGMYMIAAARSTISMPTFELMDSVSEKEEILTDTID
jgi:hypothetical protein